MSSILIEVMDCAFGLPAEGVPVTLSHEVDAVWQVELAAHTDETGSVLGERALTHRGRYRFVVSLDGYFAAMGLEPRVSSLELCFRVSRPQEGVRLLVTITSSSSSICHLVGGTRSPD